MVFPGRLFAGTQDTIEINSTAELATIAPAEKANRSAWKKDDELGAARDQEISCMASWSAKRSSDVVSDSIVRFRQVTMGAGHRYYADRPIR